jgi:hypothetical protein
MLGHLERNEHSSVRGIEQRLQLTVCAAFDQIKTE